MKKIFLLFLAISISFTLFSQEKKDKLKFSDLPGAFVLDIGVTHYRFAPGSMELKMLGSRGINIYYTYDIKLIGEKFSFSPGFGFGTTNYTFKDPVTLGYSGDTLVVKNVSSNYKGLKKSKLAANYLDIPLELRFRSGADVNSFKIALGVKAGILVSSLTKVKYKDDGWKKLKNKEDFELEKFRYGVYGRVGYGAFHLFAYYSLSDLFQKNNGPQGRSITPYMIGITLSAN